MESCGLTSSSTASSVRGEDHLARRTRQHSLPGLVIVVGIPCRRRSWVVASSIPCPWHLSPQFRCVDSVLFESGSVRCCGVPGPVVSRHGSTQSPVGKLLRKSSTRTTLRPPVRSPRYGAGKHRARPPRERGLRCLVPLGRFSMNVWILVVFLEWLMFVLSGVFRGIYQQHSTPAGRPARVK